MSKETEAKRTGWVLGTFENEDTGEVRSITDRLIRDTLENDRNDALGKLVEGSYTLGDGYGDGLIRIDLNPEMEVLKDGTVPLSIVGGPENVGLRRGRYFGLYNVLESGSFSDLELSEIRDGKSDGLLLATDIELIAGDGATPIPVTVSPRTDDGGIPDEAPYDFITAWLIQNKETGAYVTVRDMITGLTMAAVLQLVIAGDNTLSEWYGITEKNGPMMIRNGKLFTDAMRGKPRNADVWPTGAGFTIEMGKLAISADSQKELETAIGGSKTLIQLNALATAGGYKYEPDKPCRVETTISELIEQRGGDTKNKKTRAKIRRELKALSLTAWSFSNDNGEFLTIPLAGGSCYAKGDKVSFAFSSEYMGAVLDRAAGRLPLDKLLLATDEKNNPNATPIGFKLCTHTYLNKGKANENTLSVSKLLEFVSGIPSYNEVEHTDRAYTRRIIKPLERDLNHLLEIGFLDWWDYCHAKGEPLTDAEQGARLDSKGNETTLPYDIAIKCNIQWQLSNEYAEQMAETMTARERKRLDAEAAKQRDAERQKRIDRKVESNIARAKAKREMGKA